MKLVKTKTNNGDAQSDVIKVSQTKLGLFLDCARCFYHVMKMGIKRPSGFPFLINSKIDREVKKHFDVFRERGESPPELLERGLKLIPLNHPEISTWRNNLRGIGFLDEESGIYLHGAVDDVFFDPTTDAEHVVDIKATAKSKSITTPEDVHAAFKRQLDVYTWLMRNNGRPVSESAYLYHCNVISSEEFAQSLDFELSLIRYETDPVWIPVRLRQIRHCLEQELPPANAAGCELCRYVEQLEGVHSPLFACEVGHD